MSTRHTVMGSRQEPPRLPAVAMDDPIFKLSNWWAGVSPRCQREHCGGLMAYSPPDRFNGRVFCCSCSYETHEVRDRIYVPQKFEPLKPGRVAKSTTPEAIGYARRQAEYRLRQAVAS